MTKPPTKWQAYAEARLEHEQMKEAYSAAYARMRVAERELIDEMLDNEIQSWTDAEGTNVGLRSTFTIRCNQENAHLIEEWLRETTGDAEQYMKTSLDKSAVTEHVKKICSEGVDPAQLPPFLDASQFPTIAVRGWEKKKRNFKMFGDTDAPFPGAP